MVGPQVKRALILAAQLDLTREERHDLAELMTGHEGTWSRLSEDDARRVADALWTFGAVSWLYHDRARRPSVFPRPAFQRTA